MTLFLILCLLLPVALLTQGWMESHGAERGPNGFLARLTDWPSRVTVARLLLLGIGIIVVGTTVATIIDERPFLFDDSFITYRYAKNLAAGHGLVWNPGEAPTEGYTNLLLVLFVAPIIKLGGDPLLAARAISICAAVGMVFMVYGMARRELQADPTVTAIAAMGILTFSSTAELTMLGLETVAFAATMLLSYDLAERFFDTDRNAWMLGSGAVAFVAFLLRPEIVFLPVAIVAGAMLLEWRELKRNARVVVLLGASFAVPLALYLGWKLWYFGSIWPNPAFVKISGQGLVRASGLSSIGSFLVQHGRVILVAGIGLVFFRGRSRAALTCCLVVVAYVMFYLRVDTLMDMHNRFLYPAFPFLLVAALPALVAFVDGIIKWRQVTPVRLTVGTVLLVMVFYPNPGLALRRLAGQGGADVVTDREIHQASVVLKRIGTELATYPEIADVTIGGTDAGLLPYTSGARHVDMAGLVTRFIAVHKDVQVAADYFFDRKPDLIILRAAIGGDLINYEHGTLGDYPRWAHHPGWNSYHDVAGVHAGPRFDLYFFLRRDGRHEQALERIIRERLSDAGISELTTTMGTQPSR